MGISEWRLSRKFSTMFFNGVIRVITWKVLANIWLNVCVLCSVMDLKKKKKKIHCGSSLTFYLILAPTAAPAPYLAPAPALHILPLKKWETFLFGNKITGAGPNRNMFHWI